MKISADLKLFITYFEEALEARFEVMHDAPARPADVLKAVLDSVAEARKELGL